MISYPEIRDVHLEISTLCNAACPWCPRNFWGYPHNGGYPELYMSLSQARTIFSRDFLNQLYSIRINGNFGDIVMNPDGADIVEYFRNTNQKLKININTNGSARDRNFWTKLGQLNTTVFFALDGLEDTHNLYRQNTTWNQIIKNAQIFIESGGYAVWQMISFKHNQHQIEQCKQLSQDLGFLKFVLVDDGRNTGPVFDQHGKLKHVLGNYNGEQEFDVLFYKKKNDQILLEDITIDRVPCKKVSCETKQLKSIYISATGDVSPCCYTGLYPRTYGHGQYHEAANSQLVPMIKNNNALIYSIQECIEWFANVETSWNIDNYDQGRLIICDDNCGIS